MFSSFFCAKTTLVIDNRQIYYRRIDILLGIRPIDARRIDVLLRNRQIDDRRIDVLLGIRPIDARRIDVLLRNRLIDNRRIDERRIDALLRNRRIDERLLVAIKFILIYLMCFEMSLLLFEILLIYFPNNLDSLLKLVFLNARVSIAFAIRKRNPVIYR